MKRYVIVLPVLIGLLVSCYQEVWMPGEEWRAFYKNKHPHESLNDMSPKEFLEAATSDKMPTYGALEEVKTI